MLVAAAQAGDRAALDALLRRHYDRIFALCRRMTGQDADAADAAQDALLAIVRGLPRFDGRAQFGTWAYRIASNACIDELRRRNRRPDPGLPDLEHEPRDPGPAPTDTLVERLTLDDALLALPIEFRAPVALRDQLGLDYAEIASVLDIPPGTVRSRIARGRAALARHLAGNQDDGASVEGGEP